MAITNGPLSFRKSKLYFSSTKKNNDKENARRPKQLKPLRVLSKHQVTFATITQEQAGLILQAERVVQLIQVVPVRERQVGTGRQGWQRRQRHLNVGTVKPTVMSYVVKPAMKNSVTLIRFVHSIETARI